MLKRSAAVVLVGGLLVGSLTGCSAGAAPSDLPPVAGSAVDLADNASRAPALAAFYPLQYVTQRLVGERGTVQNITPPGAEPHDLELSPRAVATVTDAPLVVYLSDFQPAVDDAVAQGHGFDVRAAARLTLVESGGSDHDSAEEGHAEDGHAEQAHAEHGQADPHFWLDPTRLSEVAVAIAGELSRIDPANATGYAARLSSLRTDLAKLDGEYAQGLARCDSRELVTAHEAFGYLAERYDLHQVGITGLSPEGEPTARALAQLIDHVRATGARTVYYESLTSPDVARTVAQDARVDLRELDPLEGATDGEDYLAIMRTNLQTLRAGQSCT